MLYPNWSPIVKYLLVLSNWLMPKGLIPLGYYQLDRDRPAALGDQLAENAPVLETPRRSAVLDRTTMSIYDSSRQESGGNESSNDSYSEIECKNDGAEILENDDVEPWEGPHLEYDKYGQLTGAKYYRCRGCGREVHEDIDRDRVAHRDGCRFDGGNDR